MQQVNSVLSTVINLVILSRDVVMTYNLVSSSKDDLDNDRNRYAVELIDYFAKGNATFSIISDDETAAGVRVNEDFISLSIPVKLIGFASLTQALNRHRSDELWENSDTDIRGTLHVTNLHGDHGVEPLALCETRFEMDKVSYMQLIGQDQTIKQELELLLRWGDFLRRCFFKYSDDDVVKVHLVGNFILENFASSNAKALDQVLMLCSMTGDLMPMERKFPDVFRLDEAL